MSIYKNKFVPEYQNKVGWNASGFLHENSKYYVNILKNLNILNNINSVFEMGAGGCRNLSYIYQENNNIKFYANDLHKKESFDNMEPNIKKVVNFYEIDTLSLVEKYKFDVDLIMSVDHLMHIDPESVNVVLDKIENKWRPKYIFLKECTKLWEDLNRGYPRHFYDINFESYEVIFKNVIDLDYRKPEKDKFYIKVFNKK